MHLKLIALIAFATAVFAAPASEDVQADVIDTRAGAPETAGTRVSTVASDDHVQAPPKSCDPRRRCTTGDAQCCQFPRQVSTSADPLVSLLHDVQPIDLGDLRVPADYTLPISEDADYGAYYQADTPLSP